MIYEDKNNTRDKLLELMKTNVCSVCKSRLDVFLDADSGKAFLACRNDRSHQGIERRYEPTPFEREGYGAFNIPTRRQMMEEELGPEKTKALTKYIGVVSLTKPQAREIIEAVFPDAPDEEIARAVMLCASYGLNPLMKHVFLIKFNRWNKDHTRIVGEDWATVMGIKAKRLLSSRRGSYSYVDNTPRQMTEEEQKAIFGEVEADRLWVITKLKDPATGAEAVGYGFWPKEDKPYGTEKGNTKFNMAAIRSESQALDRLRPGEMPMGVEVIPEEYATDTFISLPEGDKKVPEQSADKTEAEEVERGEESFLSTKQETKTREAPAAELEGEGFHIDLQWLNESLKELRWSDDTTKTFLVSHYKVSPQGTLEDVIKRLTREQAEEFVHELQTRTAPKQMDLWGD